MAKNMKEKWYLCTKENQINNDMGIQGIMNFEGVFIMSKDGEDERVVVRMVVDHHPNKVIAYTKGELVESKKV